MLTPSTRSYVYVTQEWSYRDLTYFSATQSLALTVFGIIGGTIMYATRRFKVRTVFCPDRSSCVSPH